VVTTPPPLSAAVPTWLVAGGSLVVGFLVAEVTGVRAVGGAVLLVAIVWCWLLWHRRRGVQVAVGLTAVYVAAFALSHVIAGAIGAILSVLMVAAVVALVSYALADRVPDPPADRAGNGAAQSGPASR
jgi:hypothetical protein